MSDLRQAVFSVVMQFLGLHEDDTDDQLYATEFTDAILAALLPTYLRGRHDERASILGWLDAEAEVEPLPSYANAYELMGSALRNMHPESEMVGLAIRPMASDSVC